MMRKIFHLFIIAIFSFGCSNGVHSPQLKVISTFPIVKELEATVIETASVILSPERLFIFDGQLWLLQNRPDTMFSVFSLPQCQYLYGLGNRGRGPNEFLSPLANTIQVANDEKFTMIDHFSLKTLQLSKNKELLTVSKEEIFETTPINGFVKLNNTLYCSFADCGMGTKGDYEYRMFNTSNGIETKFSTYPHLISKAIDGDERCQIYHKSLVSNPSIEKFAAFYTFFKYFRIYTYRGEIDIEISVEVPPYEPDLEKRKVFYGTPVATDKYIYVPCSSKELQVWNWQGEPIAQFIIDRKFFCYAIDEVNSKMYIVSAREDAVNKVYSYDIEF